MSKEKAQEEHATRKAVIRKFVVRKMNTAKYETMDVCAEISTEIEWNSPKELLEKSSNIGKLVLKDYERFEAEALEELNLHSQNSVKNNSPKTPISKDDFDGL